MCNALPDISSYENTKNWFITILTTNFNSDFNEPRCTSDYTETYDPSFYCKIVIGITSSVVAVDTGCVDSVGLCLVSLTDSHPVIWRAQCNLWLLRTTQHIHKRTRTHTQTHIKSEKITTQLKDDRAVEYHIIDSRDRFSFSKIAVGSLLNRITIVCGIEAVRRNPWIDNKMLY